MFAIFATKDKIWETSIGLQVQMCLGLVDTGAQHGACGKDQFEKLVKYLEIPTDCSPSKSPLSRGLSPGGPCLSAWRRIAAPSQCT
eukprot:343255-Pyramimonas_sp.AAC.1